MKNPFLKALVFFALLTTTESFSQSCPVPEPLDRTMALGQWKGNLTLDGEIKSLELNISQKDGELNAQLIIPFISKKSIETETEICISEELHIKFKVDNKKYELVGRIKKKTMSGKLSSRKTVLFTKDSSEGIIKEIFSLKKI